MLALIFPDHHYRSRYESLPLLGPVWDGFCQWLNQRGYPTKAIRRRLNGGPFLECALQARGVTSLGRLTISELRSFALHRPDRWTEQIAGSLVNSLAEYLEERNALARSPITPLDELVGEYRRFLVGVRGLAPSTVARDLDRVSDLLNFIDFNTTPQNLSSLRLEALDAFITMLGRRLGRASMVKVASKLRAFLRYLATEGKAPTGLAAQIESPRCYRGELLPRALPWATVCAVIRSIDRSTRKGCRDYAMLLLIATYGLRRSEVATLGLDDICWRSQQIKVPRPKVGMPLLLPLTDEVAEAIIDYIRQGRGPSPDRHLFLRVRIPLGPIEPTAVTDAFDWWAAKVGCVFTKRAGGPHCLRHSLAVHLLRQGAAVKTIGDLLGHGDIESTGVYLRLQVEDLREVALPLPKNHLNGGSIK
jgi:site-specific recombinase XerD